ncbi:MULTISPECIES: class I SAM-dependent methyltransferase [unclassified Amycolatopsis]|uniref:class I SAM-dependent methyltransferase n=1 Tax=unclassified Amycolatopsis TaxID=2618356 RepID=UPI00106E0F89|nr:MULTISPECIES: class I SAM-dependent methyltransferase [unclassified Amycolatopsis]
MPYGFTLDDVAFLRSGAGRAALAECSALDGSRIADVTTARRLVGEHASPVLETVALRRKSVLKLASSEDWLFTGDALQQASASPVARHRASRLAGLPVHDVTCSVGADLVELSRVASVAVGSDVDPVRLEMAQHNASAAGVSPLIARADALRPISRATAVVADPARRDSAGRRVWRPADFLPPLDELVAAYPGRILSVKCAPGMDFSIAPWADEVELVSLDGQVREACLWRGLSSGVTRRATVLRSDGTQWTLTDAEPDDIPVRAAGEWLVDPDGAVVRAGLVRHYAARHGLWQLDERIAYLTGDTPPPGVRAFRVLEQLPYREKTLGQALKKLDVGRLEILVRGLDVDPDALRRKLKPRGREESTVVLTRIGRSPVAFVCRAERIPMEGSQAGERGVSSAG